MDKALSIPEIIYHIGWFLQLWDTDDIWDYDYLSGTFFSQNILSSSIQVCHAW